MNVIPAHTRRLAERLLGAYCQRICPPSARHVVPLAYSMEFDRVTVYRLRLFCGVPGAVRNVGVAQFRYQVRDSEWRLYYADAALRWKRYARRPSSRSLLELLRALDADQDGVFWGQVNGKSLRWCSARGRCADCNEEYCRVLGLGRQADARVVSVASAAAGDRADR